ncbi:MAG: MFS transporter [Motilibacteraceae bacterium]
MASRAGRLLADVRPLRESADFRRLWLGGLLSAVGGSMGTFAAALQVYRLTGSSAAVGALGAAVAVPMVVVGLFGGSLADAVDRRRLVLATSTGLLLVSALLTAQAALDSPHVWPVYLLVSGMALLSSIDGPTRRTLVAALLPPERMGAGFALSQLSFVASMICGPALAGAVTAAVGLKGCYLLDTVSFAAVLHAVARLPAVPPTADIRRPGLASVAEGLRYLRRSKLLTGVLLADLDAMVLGMPFALLPAVTAERFGGDARTLGLLTAAPAVGGLVATVLSGHASHGRRPGRTMLVAVAVWGGGVAWFGLARSLPLTLAALVLAGAADATSVVVRSLLVQRVVSEEVRGRVTAVDFVVGAGGPQLGNVRAGVVGSLTTPSLSALGGGIATVVGAGLLALAFPALVRYDTRAADVSGEVAVEPAPGPVA